MSDNQESNQDQNQGRYQEIADNGISTPDTGDTKTTFRCPECGKAFTRDTPEKAFRSVAAHALRSHSMKLSREDYSLGDKGDASGGGEYTPEADDTRDYKTRTKREKAARDYYHAKTRKEVEILDYARSHPEILRELGVRDDTYGWDRGRRGDFDEIGKLRAYESIGEFYDSKKRALDNPPVGYGARDPDSQRELEDMRRQLQERDSMIDRYEERERLSNIVERSIEKAVAPLKEELQALRGRETDTVNRGIEALENVANRYFSILGAGIETRPPRRERGQPGTLYNLIPEAYQERDPLEDRRTFTALERQGRDQ